MMKQDVQEPESEGEESRDGRVDLEDELKYVMKDKIDEQIMKGIMEKNETVTVSLIQNSKF